LQFLLKLAQVVDYTPVDFGNRTEWLALCASLIASLLFIWLSLAEHRHAVRPSTLTATYTLAALCGSILASSPDLVSVHTVFLRFGEILTQLVLLTLESCNKATLLLTTYENVAPEDSAGLLSRVFWWWLTDLLVVGKQRTLRIADTPQLSKILQPSRTRKAILEAWDQQGWSSTRIAFVANRSNR
jgi:hypothetical protein